ncbi:hypothetical protein LTR94_035464, partial [Friedmanniomyces endolithicus]
VRGTGGLQKLAADGLQPTDPGVVGGPQRQVGGDDHGFGRAQRPCGVGEQAFFGRIAGGDGHRDASSDGSRIVRSLIMALRIRDLTVPSGRSSRWAISEWGLSMKKARRRTST